ncbi:MAG: hypothetical protein AB1796_15125 [Bacillota bacterium]
MKDLLFDRFLSRGAKQAYKNVYNNKHASHQEAELRPPGIPQTYFLKYAPEKNFKKEEGSVF